MKRLSTVLPLIIAVSLAFSPLADARKMGGSKGSGFGRTYKTAPAPKTPRQSESLKQGQQPGGQQQAGQQQGAQQKPSRMGMFGGLLSGLALGGLLGSMFGAGGGFGGILMMALLAGVALVLFRKWKVGQRQRSPREETLLSDTFARKKTAVEGHGNDARFFNSASAIETSARPFGGIIGSNEVPVNMPGGFDQVSFLEAAREHYVTLQKAWDENNLGVMKEFMAPELFEQLSKERGALSGEQQTEVLFVDAGIVRADYSARVAQISVKYSGRYRDGQEGVEDDINDIWHLERDITANNAPWLIVGIES
ncbi:Tim44-like domain-containing protein [Candidatus Sororendozoicomonas aggregata]|uniref:Tim44 domain-containing protein n=1 Tax=Candidatus Sororendozoicomonas aggregata TaxID=3073239 RepID=UPI002ED5CACA